MMSDYNLQETIQQMKRLKKLGIQKKNHDGDDDWNKSKEKGSNTYYIHKLHP